MLTIVYSSSGARASVSMEKMAFTLWLAFLSPLQLVTAEIDHKINAREKLQPQQIEVTHARLMFLTSKLE